MEASLEAKEIRAVAEGEEDQATTVAETNQVTTEEVVEAVAEETAWAVETALEGVVDALDLAEVVAAVDGLDLLEVSTPLLFCDN